MSEPRYIPSLDTYACPECGEPARKIDYIYYSCVNCFHGFFIRNEQLVTDTKDTVTDREYNKQHFCLWCEKSFYSSRVDAQFCSSGCRVAKHRWDKKTPEKLLANKPLELAQYRLIRDTNQHSSDIIAKHLRVSVRLGLETQSAIVAALVTASEQHRYAFQDLRVSLQAARNG